MQLSKFNIIIYFLLITGIVLFLSIVITTLLYLYKKNQIIYYQNMESLKLKTEKNILASRVEIQENTVQRISREIHDNISLSLTLAKLYLNTFPWDDKDKATTQLNSAVEIISESISNLSDISKSLNSDIICSQGLIRALEDETNRIRKTGLFSIDFLIAGEPVYLDTQKELVIFRIIQEGFNNIIKHSKASHTRLSLHFTSTHLHVGITDNGKGFITEKKNHSEYHGAGLKNMETRTGMIGGDIQIKSIPGNGTTIRFNIPI
jgi:two-component system NarL family sensor kinase